MLNAWIDWNADGDWDDTGEQVFTDEFLVPGVNNLSVFVPANVNTGDRYARFRFSGDAELGYTGPANSGEVEDYVVTIVPTPPALTVTIDEESISEDGGISSATVSRNNGTSGTVTVSVSTNDLSEVIVPTSVDITDGNDSATFNVTAVGDGLIDGTRTVTITASYTGYVDGTDTINITDADDCTAYTFPYTVGSVSTDLVLDLRNAVACANNNATDDVIDLNRQTVTLTSALRDYTREGHNALESLVDSGAGTLTMLNGTLERDESLVCDGGIGDLTEFRFLNIENTVTAYFNGITFKNGCASDVDSSIMADMDGAVISGSAAATIYLISSHLDSNTGVSSVLRNVDYLINSSLP